MELLKRMLGAGLDDPQYHSGHLVDPRHLRPRLSPREFELTVKQTLDAEGATVTDFSSTHREVLDGVDGSYEIDIVIRFGYAAPPRAGFAVSGSLFLQNGCGLQGANHPVTFEFAQKIDSGEAQTWAAPS
jgi:hypothetical protein